MRVEVGLVVGALLDPRVGYRQLQGRVGVGLDRYPLVGVHGVGVVHVGRDVYLLDAELGEPVAQAARHVAAPAERRGLGVAAPEEHRVAVLRDILDDVVLLVLLAERVHAPDVLGAPVPALPAIGLAGLQGEAAAEVEELGDAAVRCVDDLRLAVAVDLAQDGLGAVLVVHALDLAGHDLRGLVPADALVAARAARLGVPLAVRVPVHAPHRIGNAVLRVHALLVAQRQRRDERLEARLEGLAARLELPGVQLLGRLVLVEVERADAQDLVLLLVDVDRARVRAEPEAVEAQALHDGRALHVGGHALLSSPLGFPSKPSRSPLTRWARAAWARSAPSAPRARRGPAAGWERPGAWGSRASAPPWRRSSGRRRPSGRPRRRTWGTSRVRCRRWVV